MTADKQDARALDADITASIADLAPSFLDARRRDVVAISAAVERGDFDAIRRFGHNMKGSGGGYGFDPITRFGAALEEAAMHRHADEIRIQNTQLQQYLDQLRIEAS